MTDGISDARRKERAMNQIRNGLQSLIGGLEEVHDCAFGLPSDMMAELQAALSPFGIGDLRLTLLRPEVRVFARAMEQKLRENEHKGGWQDETADWLLERLEEEVKELKAAAVRPLSASDLLDWNKRHAEYQTKVLREAADVANFAMMVCDQLGAIDKGDA